jgi:hypothetical protein
LIAVLEHDLERPGRGSHADTASSTNAYVGHDHPSIAGEHRCVAVADKWLVLNRDRDETGLGGGDPW